MASLVFDLFEFSAIISRALQEHMLFDLIRLFLQPDEEIIYFRYCKPSLPGHIFILQFFQLFRSNMNRSLSSIFGTVLDACLFYWSMTFRSIIRNIFHLYNLRPRFFSYLSSISRHNPLQYKHGLVILLIYIMSEKNKKFCFPYRSQKGLPFSPLYSQVRKSGKLEKSGVLRIAFIFFQWMQLLFVLPYGITPGSEKNDILNV